MWMRSSQVVRASCCQCQSRNCPRLDPSILRHSGIWRAAAKAVLNNVHYKKNRKIPPPKKKIPFFFVSLRFFRFILLIFVRFRFRFFLGQAIILFIFVSLRFFCFFSLISRSFSLQIFAVSLWCEASEIMHFLRFQAKRNFRFNTIFASEAKTRAHPRWDLAECMVRASDCKS
jgi:hypothetical protein